MAQRAASSQPGETVHTQFDINTANFPTTKAPDIKITKENIQPKDTALQEAFKDWEAAKIEPTSDAEKVRTLQWKVAALENQDTMKLVKEFNKPSASENELQAAEKVLREAYNAMYTAEEDARTISKNPDADKELVKKKEKELVEKKDKWLKARAALTEAQTDESTAQLSASGAVNLRTSIKSRITSLNSEIQRLEGRLTGNNPPDMIVKVEGDKNGPIEKSKPDTSGGAVGSGRGDSGTADVWTDIAFTVSAQTDDHKLEEHGKSGAFHAEAQTWYAAVKAESSFSENDKAISDFMSKCTISGSFSAMVVSIKRPWLHAELFQDFDIDIPAGTFLSPGAKTIKYWVENGDDEYNGYVRNNYGKFPAYPTAFIVAADANLSFKSSQSEAQDALNVLQTDSSVEASFGCWGIGGGAGAK